MKLKIIKVVFEENQEIDVYQYLNPNQYEIVNSSTQIVIEQQVCYLYISIFYKTLVYSEQQKTENLKENLKQEIYNLIKEKYPTHSKIISRRQDIADHYKKIRSIYDFKIIKNFGETTINKEKIILEDVLQIINKYHLEV
ncbi:hypothetical protein FLBR109950_10560 [Flavobacterium branchiophilum]|uniref:Uncharacterized protein n=1 Tax=Flavobacterium branchiophilum (strain FL-15) TaxID=1034807 RepID=G2Z583_FLABF|nr:hypothetical protein [Flavobacterium branchiophilum]CCB68589.1 Hypothetical protein FBFL15_0469 [Flavobacterium branchiophilum FL-15]